MRKWKLNQHNRVIRWWIICTASDSQRGFNYINVILLLLFRRFEQNLRGGADLLSGKQHSLVFQSQPPMLYLKLQLFSTVYHMSFSVPRACSWGTVICVPSRSACTVSSVNTPLPDKLPLLLLYLVIQAIVIRIMMLLKHDRWDNCLYCQTLLQPQERKDVSTCIMFYMFSVELKWVTDSLNNRQAEN